MMTRRLNSSIMILLICIAVIHMTVIPVIADMSPKPTLTICAENLPQDSYMAVLSTADEPGFRMWHVDESWFKQENRWIASKASEEINRIFFEYVKENWEKDGWYLWGNIISCSAKLTFASARPSHFRILVYMASEDRFVSYDHELKCTSVDFHVNLRFESGQLKTSSVFSTVSLGRAVFRLCMTIAVELAVCLIFLKNKNRKNLLIIGAANCLTQLILYIPLLSADTAEMYYPLLIGFEAAVIFIEGFIYSRKIQSEDLKHPYYYSAAANALSFAAGLILPV